MWDFYSRELFAFQTVSCTSGVMRWHLVRLVGVSPASLHTFNLYNGVQRRGEGGRPCSPTSETNKYCPSGALFRCPRRASQHVRNKLQFKVVGSLVRQRVTALASLALPCAFGSSAPYRYVPGFRCRFRIFPQYLGIVGETSFFPKQTSFSKQDIFDRS